MSPGQVEVSEDLEVKTTNPGIVLGDINDIGIGYEFQYALTPLDDEEDGLNAETDTLGLFLVYQTPGDVYVKAKAGYGLVSLKFDDFENNGSVNDTSEGFSYGLSTGTRISAGALA